MPSSQVLVQHTVSNHPAHLPSVEEFSQNGREITVADNVIIGDGIALFSLAETDLVVSKTDTCITVIP